MALLPADQALSRLTCPRCRARLTRAGDAWRCSDPSCAYGDRRSFPSVGAHPAVIDFERSIVVEEALTRSAGASHIARDAARGPVRWLRPLFVPSNRGAERHAKAMIERLRAVGGSPLVLVVGGGTVGDGARPLYETPDLGVIAFDIYASRWTHFIADAHSIPLPDRSVQAVWIQAVLEHVLDPARVVAEIERVLVDDGLVYAETPFLQQVHEGPYDFTRFTESGHRWLFRRFERIDSGVGSGLGNQVAWTVDFATRGLLRSAAAGKIARMIVSGARALDRLVPTRYSIDSASTVYFYGRKSTRELTPAEIVAHYQGAQR